MVIQALTNILNSSPTGLTSANASNDCNGCGQSTCNSCSPNDTTSNTGNRTQLHSASQAQQIQTPQANINIIPVAGNLPQTAANDDNNKNYPRPATQVNDNIDIFRDVKKPDNSWPTQGEQAVISQQLQQRISKVMPQLKGITPDHLYKMAKHFRPDLEQLLPGTLRGQQNPAELQLHPESFQTVQSFDADTEKEFAEDASPEELQHTASIMRFQDNKTGVKLEVVNSSGKKLSAKETWELLNSKVNEDVRRRVWGVVMHETLHKSIVQANPYVTVSGWYEPIKINITKNAAAGKEEAEMSTRGQADLKEFLFNDINELSQGVNELTQTSSQELANFNNNLAAYINQSPDIAMQYCQQTLTSLNSLKQALVQDNQEFRKYAYWSQNIITSSLAPILLINNYPKHAETLSEEDLALAKDFVQGYNTSKSQQANITRNIAVIDNVSRQIFTAQQQLAQGNMPNGIQGQLAIAA